MNEWEHAEFSHQRLHVYDKILAFMSIALATVDGWDKRHAIVDHLPRAVESMITNLAEGCRAYGLEEKRLAVDYATASALECAGCVDVGQAKGLAFSTAPPECKRRVTEIVRMLIGLRNSWQENIVRESRAEYRTAADFDSDGSDLHHEQLDVYREALEFVKWFSQQGLADRLPNRLFRAIDMRATTMVLNVAEGNGRFAALDRRKFLETADRATVKAAAYLDVCKQSGYLAESEAAEQISRLARVSSMVAGMRVASSRR